MATIVRTLMDSQAEEREWALRCDMAAVFRIGARLGWNEHIGNHNSLMLEGEEKPLAPARLDVIDPKTARLTISEGRYHQVRRMFAAVGNHVNALHREAVGGLELPADLAPGAWRLLGDGDIASVFDA